MTQYILLIHNNSAKPAPQSEWETFFKLAQKSELFKGGSEIEEGQIIGKSNSESLSSKLSGYMRFDSEDKQAVIDLLEQHPVVLNGGSVELCTMPNS